MELQKRKCTTRRRWWRTSHFKNNSQKQLKQLNNFLYQRLLLSSLPSETSSTKCTRFLQDSVNYKNCMEITNSIAIQQKQMNVIEKEVVLERNKNDFAASISDNESLFDNLLGEKYLHNLHSNGDYVDSTPRVNRTKTKSFRTKKINDMHECSCIFELNESLNLTLLSSKKQLICNKLKNILLDEEPRRISDQSILLDEMLGLLEKYDKNISIMENNEMSNGAFKRSKYQNEVFAKDSSNSKNSTLDDINERYASHNQSDRYSTSEYNKSMNEQLGKPDTVLRSKLTTEQEISNKRKLQSESKENGGLNNSSTAEISNCIVCNPRQNKQCKKSTLQKEVYVKDPMHSKYTTAEINNVSEYNMSLSEELRIPNTVPRRKLGKRHIHYSITEQEMNSKSTFNNNSKESNSSNTEISNCVMDNSTQQKQSDRYKSQIELHTSDYTGSKYSTLDCTHDKCVNNNQSDINNESECSMFANKEINRTLSTESRKKTSKRHISYLTNKQDEVACLSTNSNNTVEISNDFGNNLKQKRQSNKSTLQKEVHTKDPNVGRASNNYADSSDKIIYNKSKNEKLRTPNTVPKRKQIKKHINSSTVEQKINKKGKVMSDSEEHEYLNNSDAEISNDFGDNLRQKRQSNKSTLQKEVHTKDPNIGHASNNYADSSDKLIYNKSKNEKLKTPNTVPKRKQIKKHINSSTVEQKIYKKGKVRSDSEEYEYLNNSDAATDRGKENLRRSVRLQNQVPKERRGRFDNYILGYFKDTKAGRKLVEEIISSNFNRKRKRNPGIEYNLIMSA